jgi:A/G-specific adenine glycosylase
MAPDRLARIRDRLAAWYARARRDLPWRATRDPYAIWVSEVMLQQTRVDTVVPYYEKFMARFPTVERLSRAPLEDVLESWAGIGYYGRARSLHSAAREVVERYGGRIPDETGTLLRLPGIGRYTAGAVASIAYGRRAPVLDGNATRVLSRLLLCEGPPADLWEAAAELVPDERPGDFNQALMELGATVCLPRRPDCLVCPLVRLCEARRQGKEEEIPRARARRAQRPARAAVALCERKGLLLVARRPAHGLLAGMWDFPSFDLAEGEDARIVLARGVRVELGLLGEVGEALPAVRHEFTHIKLCCAPFRFAVRGGRARSERYSELRWVRPEKVARLAMSKLARRLLAVHLAGMSRSRKQATSRRVDR